MAKELSSIQAGIAGEYFVAAELTRRGYVASLTLRNTRGIDILASNGDATISVGIQVKTCQFAKPEWILNKKAEVDTAKNLFYVFVCLPPNSQPAYYVVPRKAVSQFVREDYAKWLGTLGKKGQAHRDTPIRKFLDAKHEFRDRWDLLGLSDEMQREG
jgi:hypothetical protein